MEILKGHAASVRFVVPDSLTSATYQVFKGATQIGGTSLAVVSGGVATCAIPYAAVSVDGFIKVILTFSQDTLTYTSEKTVSVVTPCLDLFEVKEILGTTDTEEARRAEAATRHIINAHCGQSFGLFEGTEIATGKGSTTLSLPRKLISMTSINGHTDIHGFTITPDGYHLQFYSWGVPPVKADYHGLHMHVGGVIHNPNNVRLGKFRNNYPYAIVGKWGHQSVPEQVREAAKLLLGVYADADAEYRDRYLTSMTAADWRIQFNSGAFAKTGHVRADQLLEDYVVKWGWEVL